MLNRGTSLNTIHIKMIIVYCVIIFGTSCAIHNSGSNNENIIWRGTVEVRILILNADGTEFLRKSKVLFFNFKNFQGTFRAIGIMLPKN
jgi:hypothetical protein